MAAPGHPGPPAAGIANSAADSRVRVRGPSLSRRGPRAGPDFSIGAGTRASRGAGRRRRRLRRAAGPWHLTRMGTALAAIRAARLSHRGACKSCCYAVHHRPRKSGAGLRARTFPGPGCRAAATNRSKAARGGCAQEPKAGREAGREAGRDGTRGGGYGATGAGLQQDSDAALSRARRPAPAAGARAAHVPSWRGRR